MKKRLLRTSYFCSIAILILGSCSKTGSSSEKETVFIKVSEETDNRPSRSGRNSIDRDDYADISSHKLHVRALPAPHLSPQAGNHYEPSQMLDGRNSTAWAVNAGSVADVWNDIPDALQFEIDADHVDYITLVNGYAKNSSSFYNNARPHTIMISRKPYAETSKSDILYRGPVKDSMSRQRIDISPKYDNSRPTGKVYVSILEGWTKGDKWPDDLCISEIEFYGH